MTEDADAVDGSDLPSAKTVTALLREARSLSRRADKLAAAAAPVPDPTTQQLSEQACATIGVEDDPRSR